MTSLPVFSSVAPRWSYSIALDGASYTLAFSFNIRETAWYLDLQDGNANPIVSGIKLVPGIFLLRQYKALAGVPSGDLYLYDSLQDVASASVAFDDLGARYDLVYLSAADIAAAEAS